MPARFRTKDRVLETSVTTGAGTYTMAGAATGFQTFVGGDVAASDLVPYFAEDGTNWEVGIGEVLSGPARLVRTTVLKSTNANAAVNWGAGIKNLRCGWPAELNTPRVKTKDVAGGAGTTVLTQDEQRADILIFTGALTGNRVIEVDTAPWRWVVFNNTTGAFTLTLKVNGQTGVAVTQGKSKVLYNDGTDVEDGYTDVPTLTAASQAEQETGTEAAKYVAPLTQQFHPSALKAWACVTVAAGVPSLAANYNVSSVGDNGVGDYTINWGTDFSTANYGLAGISGDWASAQSLRGLQISSDTAITAGAVRLTNKVDGAMVDEVVRFMVMAAGDQ